MEKETNEKTKNSWVDTLGLLNDVAEVVDDHDSGFFISCTKYEFPKFLGYLRRTSQLTLLWLSNRLGRVAPLHLCPPPNLQHNYTPMLLYADPAKAASVYDDRASVWRLPDGKEDGRLESGNDYNTLSETTSNLSCSSDFFYWNCCAFKRRPVLTTTRRAVPLKI